MKRLIALLLVLLMVLSLTACGKKEPSIRDQKKREGSPILFGGPSFLWVTNQRSARII